MQTWSLKIYNIEFSSHLMFVWLITHNKRLNIPRQKALFNDDYSRLSIIPGSDPNYSLLFVTVFIHVFLRNLHKNE
jgi:hypothetical protein